MDTTYKDVKMSSCFVCHLTSAVSWYTGVMGCINGDCPSVYHDSRALKPMLGRLRVIR
jgi:hypothetical protein